MGATKHIAQGQTDFVNFHFYTVSSWTIILGNDSEDNILKIGTYYLKLREENALVLHDAIYALEVRCSLVSFASEISYLFEFSSIVYNGNLFGHATTEGVFDVLDEIKHLPSLPYFSTLFQTCST